MKWKLLTPSQWYIFSCSNRTCETKLLSSHAYPLPPPPLLATSLPSFLPPPALLRSCAWPWLSATFPCRRMTWPPTSVWPSTSWCLCWRRTGRTSARCTSRAPWAPVSVCIREGKDVSSSFSRPGNSRVRRAPFPNSFSPRLRSNCLWFVRILVGATISFKMSLSRLQRFLNIFSMR